MNLLDATVTGAGVDVAGGSLSLPRSTVGSLPAGDIIFGVRPEGLRIVGADDEGIDLKVTVCEELGADTFVIGETSGTSGTGRFTIRIGAGDSPTPGTTVRVGLADPVATHFFDVHSGQRVAVNRGRDGRG